MIGAGLAPAAGAGVCAAAGAGGTPSGSEAEDGVVTGADVPGMIVAGALVPGMVVSGIGVAAGAPASVSGVVEGGGGGGGMGEMTGEGSPGGCALVAATRGPLPCSLSV
jgi:hypothetical protein